MHADLARLNTKSIALLGRLAGQKWMPRWPNVAASTMQAIAEELTRRESAGSAAVAFTLPALPRQALDGFVLSLSGAAVAHRSCGLDDLADLLLLLAADAIRGALEPHGEQHDH